MVRAVYLHPDDEEEVDTEKLKGDYFEVPEYVKDSESLLKWLKYYNQVQDILASAKDYTGKEVLRWKKLAEHESWSNHKITDPLPSDFVFHCRKGSEIYAFQYDAYDLCAFDALVHCKENPGGLKLTEPFLPPQTEAKATLVLDLDHTLVVTKCTSGDSAYPPCEIYVSARPGARKFLKEMAKHYELVLWTAACRFRADAALETLDPNRELFAHRLYQENCGYTKDLSKLGRDLKRLVMLDDNYSYDHWSCLEKLWLNVIVIEPYYLQPFMVGSRTPFVAKKPRVEEQDDFDRVTEVLLKLAGAQNFRKELRILKEQGVLDEIAEGRSRCDFARRERKKAEEHYKAWAKKHSHELMELEAD